MRVKITTKPKIALDNKGKFIIVKLGNKKKNEVVILKLLIDEKQ